MRISRTAGLCVAGLFILGSGPSLSAQAAKPKILVSVDNASIRTKPDAASPIMANPAVGTVFEVEGKSGPWYEIKNKTSLGILVTGYIHEMFVEVEKAEPARPPAGNVPARPAAEPGPGGGAGTAPAAASRLRVGVSVSGVAALRSGYDHRYSFDATGGTWTIADSVASAAAMGFGLDAGVFITPAIEVAVGAEIFSKSLEGTYAIDVPNSKIANDPAHAELTSPAKQSVKAFHFGLNLQLVSAGPLSPYAGIGGSYIMAKMALPQDILYQDTFDAANKHTVKITSVQLADTSINVFGFFGRAGIRYALAPTLALFAEGCYTLAKKDIAHPMMSQAGLSDIVSLNLGGFTAKVGLSLIL